LRETFSVRRAEGRGERTNCFIRHWGAREWVNLGQNCTVPVFLAGSVHTVLLPQKRQNKCRSWIIEMLDLWPGLKLLGVWPVG